MTAGIRPLRCTAFDGQLKFYSATGTLLAQNDDEQEGTKDATLFDVLLPSDGVYYVAVSLSAQPANFARELNLSSLCLNPMIGN